MSHVPPGVLRAVLLSAALLAAPARAADPPPALRLADLEGLALAHNPTLAQAHAQIEAARGRATQAGLYPNPTAGYLAQQIGDEGTAGQQGMFVSQTLVTGGKLGLNRAKFDREADAAAWQAAAQECRVLTTVRVRFYHLLALQHLTGVYADTARRAGEAVTAVEEQATAGQADHADVLEARQEKRRYEDRLDEARTQAEVAWRQLAALVGRSDLPRAVVVGDLAADSPELDHDTALGHVLAGSPELAVARAKVRFAEASVRRELAEPVPNVQVQGATAYNFADRRQQAYAQVGVMLPVFDRNQGNIRAARAELAVAQAGVDRVELSLRDRLAAAAGQYRQARESARQYREERVPAARRIADLRLDAYRRGRGEWSKVQQALRTYAQTLQQYVQALLDLRRAEAALAGYLLADGLDGPPPPPSQGQPQRQDESKKLENAVQKPVVGQAGRGLDDRIGNQRPQVFNGMQVR